MRLIIVIFFLFFIFSGKLLFSQIDSIEYNLLEQIYDFEISNNRYYFKKWDGEIIVSDSIIFNANRYFENYSDEYIPEYFDSVQFAIVSRTLKSFYREKVLFDKPVDFIRICWLKETFPIIINFEQLKNENIQLSFKVGDGSFERHGNILFDTTFMLTKRKSKKIQNALERANFLYLTNGVICQNESYMPKNFFFEYRNGMDVNIIVVCECNFSLYAYKKVLWLYQIAMASLKINKTYFETGSPPKKID